MIGVKKIGNNREWRNLPACRQVRNGWSGFTLVEMLVVVAIFSVVVVSIVNLFLLGSRAQQKIETRDSIAAAGQAMLEQMARDVRQNGVDYGVYRAASVNLSAPVTMLPIRGVGRTYSAAGTGCPDAASTPCLIINQTDPAGGSATTESMTGAGVRLEQFGVWVTPGLDPYTVDPTTGSYAADAPTTVTFLLRLRGASGDPADIRLQTTVTSRLYVR